MAARSGAMHVARNQRTYVAKSGEQRVYESVLVRRTYRDGGKVRHETLANLSALPGQAVAAIEATLEGRAAGAGRAGGDHHRLAAARARRRGARHGGAAGAARAAGPRRPERDLALALVISRVVAPGSKLSTLAWWADTTLGADLGVAAASTDHIYAAMDWLEHRQDAIEAGLARRHLAPQPNPARMALFDLSILVAGRPHCPLAARGYSRDGKKGKLQIEYGLLTDPEGRPVAVRVFPGNTGDPAAFTAIVDVVREKFGLAQMVMVGDRGMITSARIAALNQRRTGPSGRRGRLRVDHRAARPRHQKAHGRRRPAPALPLRPAGSGRDHLPGLPRRAADRLPQPGAGRRPRPHPQELLAATEKLLAPIITRVQAGSSPAPGPSASRSAR